MRRLLASVAFAAAFLIAPASALATGTPSILTPAAVSTSNVAAPALVDLTWTDQSVLGIPPITYRVLRSTIAPGAMCPTPATGSEADISGPLLNITSFEDSVSAQDVYCYYVSATDGLTGTSVSDPVQFTYDTTAPTAPVVTQTGGNGCAVFTLVSATATDNIGPVTITTGGPFPYSPTGVTGAPFEAVAPTVTATDEAGNSTSVAVPGNLVDPTRPPAPGLEVSTDPSQQKATLSWDIAPDDGAPVVNYRVRSQGPQGLTTYTLGNTVNSLVVPNLQLDGTYEFTLDATDVCGFGSTSVRLVRLNDTTPPSPPLVAQPGFDPTAHSVALSWAPSGDNIQIDHYEILRDGVPLGATDATSYIDTAPPQDALVTYVVRAVDTNGNESDSLPVLITTPDWTPPVGPALLTIDPPQGTTVTLHWPAAKDNVGVVSYTVLRDDRQIASLPAAVRIYKDVNVPLGTHAWKVVAHDAAGLTSESGPQTAKIVKPLSRAKVVSLKMVGSSRGGAARYQLKGPARLLLDLRIVGTVPKAELRIYVQSGHGRITVWRGSPASSAPQERLHSAVVRHGYVTIHLGRTFHAGRIRLVLITSGRMVIVGTGKHKPSMRSG